VDASQLKQIPLFSDASDEELKQVAAFAQSKEVPEGEVILEEGGFSRELLAIEEGTAEVTRDGEKIADLGPGDVFGEAGMLDDSMRSATVTATSQLRAYALPVWSFRSFAESRPSVTWKLLELLADRLRAAEHR